MKHIKTKIIMIIAALNVRNNGSSSRVVIILLSTILHITKYVIVKSKINIPKYLK